MFYFYGLKFQRLIIKIEIQRKCLKNKDHSLNFKRCFLLLNFTRKDFPLKFKMPTFEFKDCSLNVKLNSLEFKD